MTELTYGPIVRVGVDLSKRVCQVHAVDQWGHLVLARSLSPERFYAWCATLPQDCLVVTEACGGSHHVARQLRALGLDARLIAAHFVTPYRMAGRSGKNDANDAAAICEAASRPHMHFVPIKSAAQQGQLVVHRLREGYKQERNACTNRIRGLLTEFGLVFPQRPEKLRKVLAGVLEDASNELPGVVRLALERALLHWIDLDIQIAWCDERIAVHLRTDERVQRAAQLQGVGPITASALVATVGEFQQFRSAKQFGAWLGLVPSQNSSGGKTSLGNITKRGDDYLRNLLIQGAKSAVNTAAKRSDRLSQWLVQLKARAGWQKAAVALANKNARILWCIMTRETVYDAGHVPPMPAARQKLHDALQVAPHLVH